MMSETEWALAEKIRLLELYIDKDILWDKRAETLQEEFAKRRPADFFTNVRQELHRIFSKANPEHHIYGMPIYPRGKEAAELWLKHFRKEMNEYRERQKQMFIVAMRSQLDLIRRYQQGKVPPSEVEAILTAAREKDAKRPNREVYEAKLEEMMGKIRSEDLKNIRTFSDYYRYIRGERVATPPPNPEVEKPKSHDLLKSPPVASPTRFLSTAISKLVASPEPVLKDIQNNAKLEGQMVEPQTMMELTQPQPGPSEILLPDLFMELDQSSSQTNVNPMAKVQDEDKHIPKEIMEENIEQNQIKKEVIELGSGSLKEEVFIDVYEEKKSEMDKEYAVDIVLPHHEYATAVMSTRESVLAKCMQSITLQSTKIHEFNGSFAEKIYAIPCTTEPVVLNIKMSALSKPTQKTSQSMQCSATTVREENKTIPTKGVSPARKTTTYDSVAAAIGLQEHAAKIVPTKGSGSEKRRSTTIADVETIPTELCLTHSADGVRRKQPQQRRKPAQKAAGRQSGETTTIPQGREAAIELQQTTGINQQQPKSTKTTQHKQQPQQNMRAVVSTGAASMASSTLKEISVEPPGPSPTPISIKAPTKKGTGSAPVLTRKRKRGELDLLTSGEPASLGLVASEEVGPPAKNLRRISSQQPSPATSVTDISTTPSSSISTTPQPQQLVKKEPKLERKSPSITPSLLLFPTPISTTKIASSALQYQHDVRMEKASMLLQPSPIATPPIISEIAAATKLRSSLRRAAIASSTPSPAVNSLGENGSFMRSGNHKSTETIPKQVLLTLWKDIRSHRHSHIFDQPVSETDVPGYHSAIKKPIDLKTLKSRIESGEVKTFGEFRYDIVLMFANAVMYNSTGHYVNTYAKEMYAFALKCIEVIQYPSGKWTTATTTSTPSGAGTSSSSFIYYT